MNYTTNYQLPQWVKEDRIMMEDFNDMAAKVDEALGEQGETLAKQGESLGEKGNCTLFQTTYTGAGKWGQSNSNSLTFEKAPKVFFVFGNSDLGVFFSNSQRYIDIRSSSAAYGTLTWSSDGKTAFWYAENASDQLDTMNMPYVAVALA